MSKQVELRDIWDPQVSSFFITRSAQVTMGLLDIEIGLASGRKKPLFLTRDSIDFQLRKEKQDLQESDRLFFRYARQWWSDYLAVNPQLHKLRMVSALSPLSQKYRRSRYLHIPRRNARKVSAISFSQ